ncbi:MAG: peptidoglycan DD-metalloendopeptidase family protein [Gammaproteobacteria bacterium]|nr:peptidoglycan DD-metalloendopeptidase family protein [Gammaproteobacteria bacterium]MDH5273329.1 peptidoglycan DD-metalloendopeptidase family protein [Gammaproteobacteria bacterium]
MHAPPSGRVLAGLAAALLLLAPGPVPAATKQTPAQKEAELRKLNQRIEKVRRTVNQDVQKRDKLSAQLREAELGVQSARKELDEIRAQRLAAEARVRELQAEQARREQELDGERAELAGELRTAYVNGREEQLKLLLNQEDPSSFGRMLAYYGYFGRARADRIRGIQDQLEHLALVREKIVAEKTRLETLEQQRERRVADLKSSQDQRAQAVRAIDQQIKARGGELKQLQSQAQSLERLITELRKAIASSQQAQPARKGGSAGTVARQAPFEPLRGKLPWPVQDGTVLARFGQSRAGGSMRWQGMLIGTERGARVRAPYAGLVVYGDWLPGMGLMLVIDHGGGYMSLYGHNEELFRKVGETVAAGDVIGSVGDSGGHSQPALYFEVRRGKTPVDPQAWLTRK